MLGQDKTTSLEQQDEPSIVMDRKLQ